jgi:PKD repeat protein
MDHSLVSKIATSLLMPALMAFAAGCSDLPADGQTQASGDQSGTVQFALMASGVALASAQFTLTGPGGYSRSGVARGSGDFDVSAYIGGVPAGSGYVLALKGIASDGTTMCAGMSESFSVSVNAPIMVSVPLLCHQQRSSSGVAVTGAANVCPQVDGISANATSATVGGSPISLSVTAHDLDSGPGPLTYHWSATAGTFDDDAGQSPTYTCATAGMATVTVTVSDGYPDPSCVDAQTIRVSCGP